MQVLKGPLKADEKKKSFTSMYLKKKKNAVLDILNE